jgi:site-specific recombinase XerD
MSITITTSLEAIRQEYLLAKMLEGLTNQTMGAYEEKTARFITYLRGAGIEDIAQVTAGDIRGYLGSLTVTCNSVTVGIHHKILRTFFRWLATNEYIPADPMSRVPKPREPHPYPHVLSEAELQALLKAARPNPRDYAVVTLLLDCGIRASECCDLTVDDLDIRGCRLVVRCGKGQRGRAVYFSDLTARALARWLAVRPDSYCDALFLSQYREPLTRSGVLQLINRLGRKAGIENGKRVSPHVMRASFASCFVKAGGDAHSLARLMGHSSTRMAERYVSMAGDEVREIHGRCSPVARLEGRRGRQGS